MKTRLITMSVLWTALLLIPAASAQDPVPAQPPHDGVVGPGAPDGPAADLLEDLTPEQRARVQEFVRMRLHQQRQRMQNRDFGPGDRGPANRPRASQNRGPQRQGQFRPQQQDFARGNYDRRPQGMQHPQGSGPMQGPGGMRGPDSRRGQGGMRGPQDERGRFEGPGRGPQGPMQMQAGRPHSPDRGGMMGGLNVERRIQMMTRTLNLTPQQQETVTAILDRQRQNAQTTQTSIRDISQQLQEAVLDGNVDAARTHANTLSALVEKQVTEQAQTIRDVNDQLTEEQRDQLAQIRERMHQRAGQFRQGRGGRFAPIPDEVE